MEFSGKQTLKEDGERRNRTAVQSARRCQSAAREGLVVRECCALNKAAFFKETVAQEGI